VRKGVVLINVGGLGQQVNDNFGVSRALKNMPVLFVLPPEELGVNQITIVSHSHGAHQILSK